MSVKICKAQEPLQLRTGLGLWPFNHLFYLSWICLKLALLHNKPQKGEQLNMELTLLFFDEQSILQLLQDLADVLLMFNQDFRIRILSRYTKPQRLMKSFKTSLTKA